MIVHRIAVTYRMHTCSANPDPHIYDITRRLVETTTTGPCLTPVILRPSGVAVACRRRLPERRRCDNCQTRIEIVDETEVWA